MTSISDPGDRSAALTVPVRDVEVSLPRTCLGSRSVKPTTSMEEARRCWASAPGGTGVLGRGVPPPLLMMGAAVVPGRSIPMASRRDPYAPADRDLALSSAPPGSLLSSCLLALLDMTSEIASASYLARKAA